jgi:LPS-assembly lipoprotein
MKSIKTVLLTSLLTLTLLQGCGFHLRGAVLLPDEMAATWVAGEGVSGELLQSVRDAIRNTNGDTAASEAAATAVLLLSDETYSRRVAAVGGDGKVSEYQLHYSVRWRVRTKSGETLGEGELKQREQYQYSSGQVLGKSEEESYLRGTMVKAAVRDLMRKLRRR